MKKGAGIVILRNIIGLVPIILLSLVYCVSSFIARLLGREICHTLTQKPLSLKAWLDENSPAIMAVGLLIWALVAIGIVTR